jgi:uncharacterized protein
MVDVGFTLQPETKFLDLLEPVAAEFADLIEVAPEMLWRFDRDSAWHANSFFERIRAFGVRYGKAFIAHGVGWSPGSAELSDSERERKWLEAIRRTHEAFALRWYTDHLGASVWNGEELILPMPLPMTPASVATVRARMATIASLGLDVGVENSVFYFRYGSIEDETHFLRAIAEHGDVKLLLDLHNVFTTCVNAGGDPFAFVERLPLEHVIEIHVSGGADSESQWLPSRRVMRLDSHDDRVPEDVWRLLESTLSRCANVRAVVLERMEGTVEDADVPVLRDELTRIRSLVRSLAR